uniref:Uncharacterized protein n=1 Tax=Anguilla anguilla TaxID=7936 RepID=A0A0E9V656_ANGAN
MVHGLFRRLFHISTVQPASVYANLYSHGDNQVTGFEMKRHNQKLVFLPCGRIQVLTYPLIFL